MSTQTTADCTSRERIAAVAAPLFAERGFAAVSMRDIAQAAGMRAASLYNHYPDKEALYLAAVKEVFSRRVTLIEQALQAGGSPRERLKSLLSALVEANAGDPVAARLLQRELLDGDVKRLERLISDIFARPFTHMTALLAELAPGGSPVRTAAYLISLIHGYCVFAPILPALDPSLTTDTGVLADDLAEELLRQMV
ncbi:TetR/AcrR family transcriptional regulator [Emcibacter sp. SYSU 3D8]|uniref:TetR/AcrR family transcriptional regulator n=1 Tax=Emcibacter sp. SYSU 3D8 TaxID=3133969 RepID=UPI0031FF1278